jgi:uncharacterized protein YaaN involved in tellurite resistance
MTGVIALLFLFAGALGTTLYLVNDSDEEVGGILKYHLPILTRLNTLDVVTYEIEVIAHRLADEGTPSKQRIEEIHARAQKCQDQIDAIFQEAKTYDEEYYQKIYRRMQDYARDVQDVEELKENYPILF